MTGDGITDILGGSYGGEITLYRGQKDGSYASREIIVQEGGNDNHLATTFTSATAVDLNNDGLYDVIFGGYYGASYMLNTGTADSPRFSERKKLLTTEGTPVMAFEISNVNNMETDYEIFLNLIDWDNDGVKDLISTTSYIYEGEVPMLFHKGEMTANGLAFHKGVSIIKQGDGLKMMPGSNYNVCFGDYNNDGKQDMLLGVTVGYNKKTNEFDLEDAFTYRTTRLYTKYMDEISSLYSQKISREEYKQKIEEIEEKYKKLGFVRPPFPSYNSDIVQHGYVLLFEGK